MRLTFAGKAVRYNSWIGVDIDLREHVCLRLFHCEILVSRGSVRLVLILCSVF